MTLTQITNNRIYSWHTYPLAKKVGDYIYFAGVRNDTDWYVSRRNGTTGVIYHQKIYDGVENDDHNSPSILINSGKKSHVFYTRHGQSVHVNHQESNAGTLAFTGHEHISFPENVTYSQLMNDGSDKIVLLTRADSHKWRFRISTDYGDTWGASTTLIDASELAAQLYIHVTPTEADPNIYSFVATAHPLETVWKDIVHGTIDFTTGDISTSAGVIANLDGTNLPLAKEDLDSVGVSSDHRLLDVCDKRGKTIIYYAKWSDTTPVQYWQAVLDSGVWTHSFTGIYAGEAFYYKCDAKYIGGMAFDRNGRNIVWVSRQTPYCKWKIEQYELDEEFALVNPTLVAQDTLPLVRPTAVYGDDSAIYQKLVSYTNYQTFSSTLILAEG